MRPIRISRRTALAAGLRRRRPAAPAALAAYPDHPIEWIVAYAAGGGSDTLARILAEAMAPKLGQSMVIENRPGGATNIGATRRRQGRARRLHPVHRRQRHAGVQPGSVQEAALRPGQGLPPGRPDGPLPAGAGRQARLGIDRRQGSGRAGAGAEPGTIDYASPGVGSPHHLTMERLARESGVQLNHVPYKGAAPGAERSGRRPRRGDGGRLSLRLRPAARRQDPAARRLLGGAARGAAGRADRPGGARASRVSRPMLGRGWSCRPPPRTRIVERLSAVLAAAVADPKRRRPDARDRPRAARGRPRRDAGPDRGRARGLGAADPRAGDHAGLTWGRHIGPVRNPSRPSAPSARRSRPSAPAGPGAWSAG